MNPLDGSRLASWCATALGSPPVAELFRAGNLSRVLGLRLADGRQVVVKARRAAARHRGCVEVQRRLWVAGYPCPRPLAGPDRLDGWDLTGEEHRPGGSLLPLDAAAPGRFAAALAALVAAAPPAGTVPSLEPPPPWVAWDHARPGRWPATATTPTDLDAVPGPGWLDGVADRARVRLGEGAGVPVVGHVDFESQNTRWLDGRLHAVHDWDSVAARPEAALAGSAAAVFPATGARGEAASVEQGQRFLDAYAAARGRPFATEERELAWAAGLWTLAYNAKVETVEGGRALTDRLALDVEQRLELAGA